MPIKAIRPPTTQTIPDHAGDVTGAHDTMLVTSIRGVPVDLSGGLIDGGYLSYLGGSLVMARDSSDPAHSGDVGSTDHGDTEVQALRGYPIKIDFSLPAPSQNGVPTAGQGLRLLFDSGNLESYWENMNISVPASTRYLDFDYELYFNVGASLGAGAWIRPKIGSPASVDFTGLVYGEWGEKGGTLISGDGATESSIPSFTKVFRDGLVRCPPAPYRLDSVVLDLYALDGSRINCAIQIVSGSLTTVDEYIGTAVNKVTAQQRYTHTFAGTTAYGDGYYFLPLIFQDEFADMHGRLKVRFVA